jgi:hypothetical protein
LEPFLDEFFRWVKFVEVANPTGAFSITAFVDSNVLLLLPSVESVAAVRTKVF